MARPAIALYLLPAVLATVLYAISSLLPSSSALYGFQINALNFIIPGGLLAGFSFWLNGTIECNSQSSRTLIRVAKVAWLLLLLPCIAGFFIQFLESFWQAPEIQLDPLATPATLDSIWIDPYKLPFFDVEFSPAFLSFYGGFFALFTLACTVLISSVSSLKTSFSVNTVCGLLALLVLGRSFHFILNILELVPVNFDISSSLPVTAQHAIWFVAHFFPTGLDLDFGFGSGFTPLMTLGFCVLICQKTENALFVDKFTLVFVFGFLAVGHLAADILQGVTNLEGRITPGILVPDFEKQNLNFVRTLSLIPAYVYSLVLIAKAISRNPLEPLFWGCLIIPLIYLSGFFDGLINEGTDYFAIMSHHRAANLWGFRILILALFLTWINLTTFYPKRLAFFQISSLLIAFIFQRFVDVFHNTRLPNFYIDQTTAPPIWMRIETWTTITTLLIWVCFWITLVGGFTQLIRYKKSASLNPL